MHAVVLMVTIHDPEAAISKLREEVVPVVKQAPGLVTGHWTRKDDSGIGMIVFESEDAANAARERAAAMADADDNVTLESVEVREVVANV
ncbi:MAG TPA: hypothetical protein VHQ97_07730 [Solirubrobacterales bacterium]|jgi:hypothetical protein|nr:hypothetical protein [Solirubrobacterales bacterium]